MSTSLTPASSAEPILCDTSFISVVQVKGWLPTWQTETRDRLSSAILGISVITIAEVRDGHITANWGEARRTAAEQLMAAYLWVPHGCRERVRAAPSRLPCLRGGCA